MIYKYIYIYMYYDHIICKYMCIYIIIYTYVIYIYIYIHSLPYMYRNDLQHCMRDFCEVSGHYPPSHSPV